MKSSRKKINVDVGTLIMKYDGDIVHFDILDAKNSSTFDCSLCAIGAFDFIVQQDFELQDDYHEFYVKLDASLRENLALPQENKTNLQPSIIQASNLELLALLEDKKDEKLEKIKQEAEMEI